MKIESMTIRQILELTDTQLEALSEQEQRMVADCIGALLDFELRHGSARMDDLPETLGQVLWNSIPARSLRSKIH